MTHLTKEKMDRINYLITEVSLECLGNKFFDINGDKVDTLYQMINRKPIKSPESDTHSALWLSISTEKLKLAKKHEKPRKETNKRRASFSETKPEPDTDTSNDPESLLIPIPKKAAKIANRRQTISVQHMKAKQLQLPQHKIFRQQVTNPNQPIQRKITTVADIKNSLKEDINARKFDFITSFAIRFTVSVDLGFSAMRTLSETQEDKYRTFNTDPNMESFYKSEEKSLFAQCNTLIRFIKFIQGEADNSLKLAKISQAILDLQKDY